DWVLDIDYLNKKLNDEEEQVV
ncbi:MAG: hypothetical protein RL373_1468, partial [Pseudomonadota bacterium]